jgi:hypothetical protein
MRSETRCAAELDQLHRSVRCVIYCGLRLRSPSSQPDPVSLAGTPFLPASMLAACRILAVETLCRCCGCLAQPIRWLTASTTETIDNTNACCRFGCAGNTTQPGWFKAAAPHNQPAAASWACNIHLHPSPHTACLSSSLATLVVLLIVSADPNLICSAQPILRSD